MHNQDVVMALVTEPPLMALVVFTGLAVAAWLAVFVVDAIKQFNLGKDREP